MTKEKKRKFNTIFTDHLDFSEDNMDSYRQQVAENLEIEPEKVTDDQIYEEMYRDIDFDWEDFTSDMHHIDKKFPNEQYTITGSVGLWDGRHQCYPKTYNSLYDAVLACHGNNSTENFLVREDQYGKFYVDYSHHDGTNCFVISKANGCNLHYEDLLAKSYQ